MTDSAASRLSATSVAGASPGDRHLLLFHGIYGRGRNWQAIARRVVGQRPDVTCWLVDLPHHGDSPRPADVTTLDGMAAAVAHWLAETGVSPSAVLGHSYGGKVALALAARLRDRPLQTWLIDSTPAPAAPGGSAWRMLAVVRGLPDTFATRADAVAGIEAGGFPTGVAQWMSTNLERASDGSYRWALDFELMERLLRDFFATDLWSVLEQPAAGHDVHVLKASESGVITDEAARRIEQLAAASGQVHLHQLEGGHWIHAEAPDAVAALLVAHLW